MKLALYSLCLCLAVYNVGRFGTALIHWATNKVIDALQGWLRGR